LIVKSPPPTGQDSHAVDDHNRYFLKENRAAAWRSVSRRD
jgi:hypothetical protein